MSSDRTEVASGSAGQTAPELRTSSTTRSFGGAERARSFAQRRGIQAISNFSQIGRNSRDTGRGVVVTARCAQTRPPVEGSHGAGRHLASGPHSPTNLPVWEVHARYGARGRRRGLDGAPAPVLEHSASAVRLVRREPARPASNASSVRRLSSRGGGLNVRFGLFWRESVAKCGWFPYGSLASLPSDVSSVALRSAGDGSGGWAAASTGGLPCLVSAFFLGLLVSVAG